MTDFEALPTDRDGTTYFVLTESGAVHIMDFHGRLAWRRESAPGAGVQTERPGIPVSELDDGWRIGMRGYLICADETYLSGATWHRTSRIVRTTDQRPGINVQKTAATGPNHNVTSDRNPAT